MCWVILHLGHLHIYYREGSNTSSLSPRPSPSSPLKINQSSSSTTSISSDITTIAKKKAKKKFMHLTSSSSTQTNNYQGDNSNNNNGLGKSQVKKEPYQELNIYLGNTFCERLHTHAFILQLANGNTYVFDGGSESHVTGWIHDCNYWAAIETKIVPTPPIVLFNSSNSLSELPTTVATVNSQWKKPPLPAGSSVLNKQEQQKAIDQHILYLQEELTYHLKQEKDWVHHHIWHDKKLYLELEIKKYLYYHQILLS
ncbi:unnamed protein product [Cunninghamella echinulata]